MAYRNAIYWYMNGFSDEKSAQESLEDQVNWFRRTFNIDEYTVNTSVSPTREGWKAELKAEKDA